MIENINIFLDELGKKLIPGISKSGLIEFKIQFLFMLPILFNVIMFFIKKFMKWFESKEKILKTSPLPEKIMWFCSITILFYIFNILFSYAFTSIITYGFHLLIWKLFHFNFFKTFLFIKDLIYFAMISMIFLIFSKILIKKLKLKEMVNQYITLHKKYIWIMILLIPISLDTTVLSVICETITFSRISMIVLILDLIIINFLLIKIKQYFRYDKVTISLKNATTLYVKYEDIKKDQNYIIRTIKDDGKAIKQVYYPLSEIKNIVYHVDTNIDEKYEKYIIEKYEKLLSLKFHRKAKKSKKT